MLCIDGVLPGVLGFPLAVHPSLHVWLPARAIAPLGAYEHPAGDVRLRCAVFLARTTIVSAARCAYPGVAVPLGRTLSSRSVVGPC